jgi:tetratricopeptide repeat protein
VCSIFIHALPLSAAVNFLRRTRRLGHVGTSYWYDFAVVAMTISFTLVAHGTSVRARTAALAGVLFQSENALSSAAAYVDAVTPSAVPSGSPSTEFSITGTGLNKASGLYLLDPKENWIEVPLVKGGSSTRATVVLPAKYLAEPRFVLLSTAPDFGHAQSVLVYSGVAAQAVINRSFKIAVIPEDVGSGGTISVTGTGFISGMQVVLGRGGMAGVILRTQFSTDSYLSAEVPRFIPADDLFVSVLSADGKSRSEPFGVISSYPEPEDERSQQPSASSPSAGELNDEGLLLLKRRNYEAAAFKFVEAARLDPSTVGIWNVPKGAARFSNNAGFAFYEMGRYREAAVWLRKAIAIDPQRAVAYLNLGDALAKLNRNAEARQAYRKFLELASDSKSAPRVRKKLEALPQSP